MRLGQDVAIAGVAQGIEVAALPATVTRAKFVITLRRAQGLRFAPMGTAAGMVAH
jgi:hypothetical protein